MRLLLVSSVALALTNQAMAQFPEPKPTDAHKVLARDSGTWNCDVKMYLAGPTGEPTEFKGVETNDMVSGGLYARSTFKCKMGDRDFEGHALMGYDPRKKVYTGLWVDNFSVIPTQMTGKWDADKRTMTMMSKIVDPQSGQEFTQKQVTKYPDDNTKEFTIYLVVGEGDQAQDVKLMELIGKKK